jgi:hypothetical protein
MDDKKLMILFKEYRNEVSYDGFSTNVSTENTICFFIGNLFWNIILRWCSWAYNNNELVFSRIIKRFIIFAENFVDINVPRGTIFLKHGYNNK